MVAVDILQVPLLTNNNCYLLVLQDYFTKWVKAVPLSDQTASNIDQNFQYIWATTNHTLRSMVWSSVSVGPYCNHYELMLLPKLTGNHIYLLFCMHIEHHVTAIQLSLPRYYCMARTNLICML